MSDVINARIWEPVPQQERFNRYEIPLMSALNAYRLGEIVGASSQMSMELEIEFAEIEIDIYNLDEGINMIKHVLEQAGAPSGSELRFLRHGSETVIPFGKNEGLAIYLDGINLPDNVYDTCTINELAGLISGGLSSAGAEIRGSWVGPNETSLYIYGPDAETVYDTIEPVLASYPLCQNARIVIRHGNPSLNPRHVRLPLHGKTGGGRLVFFGKKTGSS